MYVFKNAESIFNNIYDYEKHCNVRKKLINHKVMTKVLPMCVILVNSYVRLI